MTGTTKPTALLCVRESETFKTCAEALERSGFAVQVADWDCTVDGATILGLTADVVIIDESYAGRATARIVEQLKAFQTHATIPYLVVVGTGSSHELASRFGIPARQCVVEKPLTRWSVMNALSWVITRPVAALTAAPEAAGVAVSSPA